MSALTQIILRDTRKSLSTRDKSVQGSLPDEPIYISCYHLKILAIFPPDRESTSRTGDLMILITRVMFRIVLHGAVLLRYPLVAPASSAELSGVSLEGIS